MSDDFINEPTRKCEYCGQVCYKEEMHQVKSDEYDYLDICESCWEANQ